MSIQTRHLLHDIIYHIFMGWNSFQITHLLLVSVFYGIQSQALRLISEYKALPKVLNVSWDDVNVSKNKKVKT